jgi:hypothetical protein
VQENDEQEMNGLFRLDCTPGDYVLLQRTKTRTRLELLMFTRIATAVLAVTLLGASAYGLAPQEPVASEPRPSATTVIEKNSVWPLKDRMTMDPCTVRTCQEA